MSQSRRFGPLARIAVITCLGAFIAAPTPGNVGGCSDSAGGQPVTGMPPPATGPMSQEYNYFDQGLCANFCERLRDCGALCAAFSDPTGCDNDSADSFARCVRDPVLAAGFFGGQNQCPHVCPPHSHFSFAYNWDVQACGDAVQTRTCSPASLDSTGQVADDGTIGSVLSVYPSECANPCVPDSP